ncbi:MAG: hypothetical protein OXU45_05190 [Candidatus Melainabacteria bacterium]|nr:hypothetical protein [Candidatus Melainabacteria bacterium]
MLHVLYQGTGLLATSRESRELKDQLERALPGSNVNVETNNNSLDPRVQLKGLGADDSLVVIKTLNRADNFELQRSNLETAAIRMTEKSEGRAPKLALLHLDSAAPSKPALAESVFDGQELNPIAIPKDCNLESIIGQVARLLGESVVEVPVTKAPVAQAPAAKTASVATNQGHVELWTAIADADNPLETIDASWTSLSKANSRRPSNWTIRNIWPEDQAAALGDELNEQVFSAKIDDAQKLETAKVIIEERDNESMLKSLKPGQALSLSRSFARLVRPGSGVDLANFRAIHSRLDKKVVSTKI